ncbi:ParB/Srx family N-terminal domain-containing protein [Pigmentiphaga litoralis]|uniref:ParB/Srx family N-terminal domain-containing protein n=1 Tax=Pigmentiphaga litoralis TaxID=516702 RepID=UPI003B42855D
MLAFTELHPAMMFPPLRLRAAAGTFAAVAASMALTGPAVASAPDLSPFPRAIADIRPGAVLHLRIDELRPTQPAVGYDQVYATLERYRRSPQDKFDDYCFYNGQRGVRAFDPARSRIDDPASFACKQDAPDAASPHAATLYGVVIGPGGRFYLQSGHHTAVALTSLPDGGSHVRMTVRVEENYSLMIPGAASGHEWRPNGASGCATRKGR